MFRLSFCFVFKEEIYVIVKRGNYSGRYSSAWHSVKSGTNAEGRCVRLQSTSGGKYFSEVLYMYYRVKTKISEQVGNCL